MKQLRAQTGKQVRAQTGGMMMMTTCHRSAGFRLSCMLQTHASARPPCYALDQMLTQAALPMPSWRGHSDFQIKHLPDHVIHGSKCINLNPYLMHCPDCIKPWSAP